MFITFLLPLLPKSQEFVSPLEGDIVSTEPACLRAHRQKQGMWIHRSRGRKSQKVLEDRFLVPRESLGASQPSKPHPPHSRSLRWRWEVG